MGRFRLRQVPPPTASGPAASWPVRPGSLEVGPSNRRPIAYAALATGDAIGRLRLLAHGGETDVDCRPAPSSGIRYDAELAARLWDMSTSLTAVGDPLTH